MGDHVCPWWLAYAFDNRFRRLFHDPRKILAPYVSTGMTVLDVGCGMGFFSIALARLVGDEGAVLAADVQDEMLTVVAARARSAGLSGRIRAHRCDPDDLHLASRVDFILAFWMVHEVPDARTFFDQARSCLAPGARLLVVEPKLHVREERFQEIVRAAEEVGLKRCGAPPMSLSRSVLLEVGPVVARSRRFNGS
jgi:ubiquinone/menaquinone biosynthesis C-methylase UbiE